MTDRILKWAILLMVGFGVLAGVAIAFQSAVHDGKPDAPRAYAEGAMEKFRFAEETRLAPSAAFENAAGETATLDDFEGRIVLLNLWATWCPPCLEELPALTALKARYSDRPLEVVTVSVDKEGPARAGEFLGDLGVDLPSWNDKTLSVAFEAKARGFPTTVLYDATGREIGRVEASADWASPEAFALIDAAISGEFGGGADS